MKKVYHLSTCNTCQRIIKDLNLTKDFQFQNVKEKPVTEEQLQELHKLSGSYEDLFNKRARLYKELGLKNKNLDEKAFRRYLLEHYTFLKRPVIVNKNEIFIGNSKKTVEAAMQSLND